jgi:cell division protein FtsN
MSSGKRKKRRSRSGGGTLLGILLGLLAGLAIAVAAALYMTRSSVPFVDKVKRPTGTSPAADAAAKGEVPDPNRAMQKARPQPADAGATQASGATPPVAPPTVAPPPVAPPPVASETPAAPAPETPADRSSYLLQAGAFKMQEDADGMRARLALIGFEGRIVTAEVNGVTFYRVRVGPYGRIEDMNRARSRLAENGIEASVVRSR